MSTKVIALYILDQILSIFGVGVALFWPAGRIDWWPAWAAIAVWLVWFTAMDVIILRFNPELMAERLTPPKGAKTWDKVILSILRLTQLVRYILAGLDQHYGWTGGIPLSAQIAALTVCILSCALFVWAMASNTFFSQIVRIQSDHGHAVATEGPYRYMRHPGYVGMILFEFGISTLLASWWAIIAGGLCAVLLILRTALEDRTLQAELTGYVDYARQVRYRLLPGIW
ncbi:MAG: isoprenylcysteine carboxylmethyltransferase family protein [Anaerolineaceae bacterium]|jgi:protein-S-isoprenylcysteine O-methyltransferase Ste14